MSKEEILLDVIAIKRKCRDIFTYDNLCNLEQKLKKEIEEESK